MAAKFIHFKIAISVVAIVAMSCCCEDVNAQRRAPFQIGGPNGMVAGGGQGFKVGGRNGIHFGGGQGAKFGPTEFGMHFGNGQGARFGGQNLGMQFGGGQGARFGTPDYGMQFGHGEGARFGRKGAPLMQFGGGQGATIGAHLGEGQFRDRQPVAPGQPAVPGQPVMPLENGVGPAIQGPTTQNIEPATPTLATDNSRINIRYPREAPQPFEYSLNGSKANFAPGANIALPADRQWDFRIPAGQEGQQLRYSQLKPGNYVLRQGDSGWQLFQEKKTQTPASQVNAPSVLDNGN